MQQGKRHKLTWGEDTHAHTHTRKHMMNIHLHNLCRPYVCDCIQMNKCYLVSAAWGSVHVKSLSEYSKHALKERAGWVTAAI